MSEQEMQNINTSGVYNEHKPRYDGGGNFGTGETDRGSMQKFGLSKGEPRVNSFFQEAKP